MQIYVVKPGDTLWAIAKTFNLAVNEIVKANEIPDPNSLVVGQAMVIPISGRYYWVVAGDSLWSIGRRFGINYINLAQLNKINVNSPLNIGTRLYIPSLTKTRIESNAYIEPIGGAAGPALLTDARKAAPTLTYLAPFSYKINRNGSLGTLNLQGITQIADEFDNSLIMVITNIQEGGFSGELARAVLSNPSIQDTLINNIAAEAKRIGVFSDIHFDFEYIPADLRDEYTAFLRKATTRLHQEGFMVSAALAPKTSSSQQGQWYEAHDYKAIGSIVDFVVIMTYEWGYSGGPPMPVSPIGPVERVLKYALTEIPASKIMMGQNLYGYDWTLPYVTGGQFARTVSPQAAIELAKRYKTSIRYDTEAQAPYFNYLDTAGKEHIVWFEDARSIQAKFDLLKKLNLLGISYWKLGISFPQNWLLLGDNFIIEKNK